MNILFIFILGVLFVQFVLPLIDSILSLICAFIEMLKGKISVKIAHYNKQIHKDEEMRPIGFKCEEDVDD